MDHPTEGTPRPRGLVLCLVTAATLASCSGNPTTSVGSKTLAAIEPHASSTGERQSPSKALFAQLDKEGRRLSLVLDKTGLTLNRAGAMSYAAAWGPGDTSPLEHLMAGEDLPVSAFSGHRYGQDNGEGILRLRKAVNQGRSRNEEREINLLPIEFVSESGRVEFAADLKEEPAGHEITIVSYNVENFFDQMDEDRNSDYGDYRIRKNDSGQSSNYGERIQYQGRSVTFTDVKAQNIRKALTAVTPEGPEIAGLVEVESRKALDTLLEATRDLGYKYAQFTDWPAGAAKPAVGMAVLSKFPVLEWSLITPKLAKDDSELESNTVDFKKKPRRNSALRPILKAKIDVFGHDLLVYVNHWKSKAGPESLRKAYAVALEADLEKVLSVDPRADYVLLGDFNSEYNEAVILTDEHNDTNGTTGINHVLKSQGDELAVAQMHTPFLKYDLHYELDADKRKSAWHPGFEWSSLDHIIIGPGLYDQKGLTYVDGSFDIARQEMPRLEMLFTKDGKTKRWFARRNGPHTQHSIGGFSDHLPLYARLRVAPEQSSALIPLPEAGNPDAEDAPVDAATTQHPRH